METTKLRLQAIPKKVVALAPPQILKSPDGVTHISEDAFKDKGLTSVTFPESVEEIAANAFTGNSFSSYIYIPNENAAVDANAFDSSVTVAQEGTDSCFVRDANDTTVLTDFPCSTGTTIEIPSDIVSIRRRRL